MDLLATSQRLGYIICALVATVVPFTVTVYFQKGVSLSELQQRDGYELLHSSRIANILL